MVANPIDDDPSLEEPFEVQSVKSLISGYSSTPLGVDLFITHDRVIILDTQPLLDLAIADLYLKEKGSSAWTKDWSVETVGEIVSLKV